MSVKTTLTNEASKFLQMLVPMTYTVDPHAAPPTEVENLYKMIDLIIVRLQEQETPDEDNYAYDNGIYAATDILDYVIRPERDLYNCPRDYLAFLLKNVLFQFTVHLKYMDHRCMEKALDFYIKLENLWTRYKVYNG